MNNFIKTINMKRYRIYNLLAILTMMFATLSFSACSNEDLDTNQYDGSTHLNVFGPCPVARGGELRFLGTGLDNVTKITIPGSSDITDINRVSSEDIRITVPQDATEGTVIMTLKDGSTITTKTPISYSEPISIDNYSPTTVNPGDVITIKGDYLNLVHAVIFSDGVSVSDSNFISHSRKEIKVPVPIKARTGKIIVSNEAEGIPNWVYSESILTVNLPTFTSLSSTSVKPGSTLTINGENLGWIKSISFAGVETTKFTVSEEKKSITVTVPTNAPKGDVTMTTYSGITVAAGSITTINPNNLTVSPNPVKNGDMLTITGKNLDLVSGLSFPNSEMVYPTSEEESKLTVKVPTTAQDGNITLTMQNGETITVPYTLIKPKATSFSPAIVPQGTTLTVNGTNLDLVSGIIFNGLTETTAIANITNTSFTALVPSGALSGDITLVLVNGTKIIASGLQVTEPLVPTVTGADAIASPGLDFTITGAHLDEAKGFFLDNYGLTIVSAEAGKAIVKVPESVPYGTYAIKYLDAKGNIQTSQITVTVQSPEYTIFDTPTTISGWGEPHIFVDRTTPTDISKLQITPGVSKMYVYYSTKDASTWFDLQLCNANWSSFGEIKPSADAINGPAPYGDNVKYEVTITNNVLSALNVSDGWSNHCMIIQGDGGVTVNKISILP